jgi:hypothetical protein
MEVARIFEVMGVPPTRTGYRQRLVVAVVAQDPALHAAPPGQSVFVVHEQTPLLQVDVAPLGTEQSPSCVHASPVTRHVPLWHVLPVQSAFVAQPCAVYVTVAEQSFPLVVQPPLTHVPLTQSALPLHCELVSVLVIQHCDWTQVPAGNEP